METRSAKRRKLLTPDYSSDNITGEDRITDLPNAILHQILLLLPIKTIAQTSLLSKRWRYLWYTFPDLDFTSAIPSGRPPIKLLCIKNLGNVISQTLSLRYKLSDLRTLRFYAYMTFSGLHALIRSAVRHGVQELDIEVVTKDIFNFPRSIISSDSLRILRLKSCPGFRLPPSRVMRSGFQALQTLSLSRVDLEKQSSLVDMFTDCSFPVLKKLFLESCSILKHLRVSCRLLEDLGLKTCFHLEGLEVSCPKLEVLSVSSCFGANSSNSWLQVDAPRLKTVVWVNNSITSKTSMENLVCLHEVTIGFLALKENLNAEIFRSISSFLTGLSHAQCLTIDRQCVEILSKNNQLASIFFHPFVKLKSLELHANNVQALKSLLKVAPSVHTLVIKVTNAYKAERRHPWNRNSWDISSFWEEKHWESQSEALMPLLHYLKVVKIHGFSECENDMSLVKFLLKHGRVLQDLILYSANYNSKGSKQRDKIKLQMMGFSKASLDAKLAFQSIETPN